MNNQLCEHLMEIKEVKVGQDGVCEECVKQNQMWVHLRTCQSCGVTLCCDSSPQTHMTRHYHETKHPVVASAERGEQWLWCYHDSLAADY